MNPMSRGNKLLLIALGIGIVVLGVEIGKRTGIREQSAARIQQFLQEKGYKVKSIGTFDYRTHYSVNVQTDQGEVKVEFKPNGGMQVFQELKEQKKP